MIETERLHIYPASKEAMEDFISSQTNNILKTAYQEMLDGCLFKGISPNGSTEIGYGISEEYHGRGYAAEAVNAVVEWVLQQHIVCSVEAETEAGNLASIRVLQKCGFHYHHTAYNVPCAIEGVMRTEHVTCISREEWLSKR